KLLSKMIDIKGWKSEIAVNGNQAIEMAAVNDYDAILMDIQMPDIDGVVASKTILKMLVEAGRRVPPIIAVTANVMVDEIQQYTNAGMHDFISKPINMDQLYDVINKIIEHNKRFK
ncbi:MAG: response regulator, partial [Bacteroidales bacterium]|nr:response regulator [Bacteroidales bacterium]